MDLTFAQLSYKGPVRPNNEDFIASWIPQSPEERLARGCVTIIADGVGGQNDGEIASRMAAETALREFIDAKPETALSALLFKMFNHANLAVYDTSMAGHEGRKETGMGREGGDALGRMATTLTISVFRNSELAIGHVGDCRVYLIHGGQIKCVTSDHTHVAFHQRMGLFSGADSPDNPMRGMLSRSVGQNPVVQADFYYETIYPGDYVIQCTDGVHVFITPEEILEKVTHRTPDEACKEILALCESRGTEDNLSIQIAKVNQVEQLSYYRGTPVYTQASNLMNYEPQPGQVLDNRFEITDVVSRSGMASIFKANDLETGKVVALKVPFMQFESDPAFYSRFLREEEIGLELDHPAILKVIKVDQEKKSRPYIAMELLEGKTLDMVMHQQRPMPIDEAISIACQLCDALAHMHSKNIVHRDLKPQNVMVCRDGTLRIMDFGIAKAAKMRRITFTGFSPAMGTPDYMAPEQVKGKRGDHRTDIYSLGAILYEMVTGEVPFEGANPYQIMQARVLGDPVAPRRINPLVTPQLEETILHAMARDIWDRFDSAAAMAEELRHPENVQLTGRAEHLQRPQMWQSNWKRSRNFILLALIPVVAFGLIYLFARRR